MSKVMPCPYCQQQGIDSSLVLRHNCRNWKFTLFCCEKDSRHLLLSANIVDKYYLDHIHSKLRIASSQKTDSSPLCEVLYHGSILVGEFIERKVNARKERERKELHDTKS